MTNHKLFGRVRQGWGLLSGRLQEAVTYEWDLREFQEGRKEGTKIFKSVFCKELKWKYEGKKVSR